MAVVRERSQEQNNYARRQRWDVLAEAAMHMEVGTQTYVQPAAVTAASSVVAAEVTPDTNPYFDQRRQDYDLVG